MKKLVILDYADTSVDIIQYDGSDDSEEVEKFISEKTPYKLSNIAYMVTDKVTINIY